MASATGTSVVGRQVLVNVPNPTSIISVQMRGASIGQTGKLGWLAVEQAAAGTVILEIQGREWWRDGIRWSIPISSSSVVCVMYWRKAGLLWQVNTA